MMIWIALVAVAVVCGLLWRELRALRARVEPLEQFRADFLRRRAQIVALKETPGRQRLRDRLLARQGQP